MAEQKPKNPDNAKPRMVSTIAPGKLPNLRREINKYRVKYGKSAIADSSPMYHLHMGSALEAWTTKREAEEHVLRKYGRRTQFY